MAVDRSDHRSAVEQIFSRHLARVRTVCELLVSEMAPDKLKAARELLEASVHHAGADVRLEILEHYERRK